MAKQEATPQDPEATPERELPDVEAGKAATSEDEIAVALRLVEGEPAPDTESVPAPAPEKPEPDAEPEPEATPDVASSDNQPTGIAKGWAAVKKAEKQLQADREALKRQKHELEQAKKAAEEQGSSDDDLRTRLKADPFGTLAAEGLPFNDLAQRVIEGKAQPKAAPDSDPKTAALEQQIAELKTQIQQQSEQQVYNNYKAQVEELLATPDYKVLAANPNAVTDIMQAAGTYYQQTGELLPASQVTATMQETWKEHLQTLKSHAAVSELLGLQVDSPDSTVNEEKPPAPEPEPASPEPDKPVTTLTNDLSTTPSAPEQLSTDLSDDEELRRAAKLVDPNVWSGIGDG